MTKTIFGIAVLLFFIDSDRASAQTPAASSLSPAVVAALEANEQGLLPLKVTYTSEIKTDLPPGELVRSINLSGNFEDFVRQRTHVLANKPSGVFYRRQERTNSHGQQSSGETFTDGNKIYSLSKGADAQTTYPTSLIVYLVDYWRAERPLAFQEFDNLLSRSGFVVFHPYARPASRTAARSLILYMLDNGGKVAAEETTDDGNVRVVIHAPEFTRAHAFDIDVSEVERNLEKFNFEKQMFEDIVNTIHESRDLAVPRIYTFTLDPQRNYAVTSFQIADASGRTLTRSLNSEFERVGGRDVWLPRVVRDVSFTTTNQRGPVFQNPMFESRMAVQTVDAAPDNGLFVLGDLAPGTSVTEYREATPRMFVVPASAEGLDQTLAALGVRDGGPRRFWVWLVVTSLVITCAGLTWWAISRRRPTRGVAP